VGTGAGSPKFAEIPGEAYNGVFSANEFLTRVNLMRGYRQPL
jgi:glutamate synthase (NADPH/NADH) small chain